MDTEEPEAEAFPESLPDSREPVPDPPVQDPPGPPGPPPPAPAPSMTRTEARLRKLAGRKLPYDGPIVAIARGWVSRDGRIHVFAARFLDFAVLTPDHLVLCSTGFFTRRPRRRVFRQALGRLEVIPIGDEPTRSVRVVGNFSRPIRIELRQNEAGLTFARELLACTRPTVSRAVADPEGDA
jgi:hypothetical protein